MSTPDQDERLAGIVAHQAEMESLWLAEPTITEALLMAALRHLHAEIEGKPHEAEHAKAIYWNVEDEL